MMTLLCLILAALYLLGGRRPVRVLDTPPRWHARHWRATAFLGGLGMLLVGLSGPADALARSTMASRTAQLIALMMVVAPLLVLGASQPRFRRLFRQARSARPRMATPIVAFLLFNGAILVAFLPAVARATAEAGWPRQLEQVLLVSLAYFFWSQAIDQPPTRSRLTHIGRVVFLILSSAQLRVLGAILGFASTPFYPVPLVDQQIAGGIIMVPGVITDLVVLTACLYLWLGQDDRRQVGRGDPGGRRRGSIAREMRA
jgi:cytochrome c oxidase assembly factor CtaG